MASRQVKAPGGEPQSRRLFAVYWIVAGGLAIEGIALVTGLVLAAIQGGYYANPKAARDAAEAGSALLAQLGQFSAVAAWLQPLLFVGVATFFLAIVVALSTIVKTIPVRGAALAEVATRTVKRS